MTIMTSFFKYFVILAIGSTCCYGRKSTCKTKYDFIVVGAGTGGSMVASELAQQFPNDDILLIEEGSFSRINPTVDNVGAFLSLANDVTVERGYVSTPQSGLNHRVIPLSRAKVTGGCNSHNAQNYVLADEMDFNRWGNIPGWSLNDVLDEWDEILAVNSGTQFDQTNPFMQRLFDASEDNGYEPTNNIDLRNGVCVCVLFPFCVFVFVVCGLRLFVFQDKPCKKKKQCRSLCMLFF